jgi:hypothetical protein
MVGAQKTAASHHTVIVDIVAARVVRKAELAIEESIFIPFPNYGAV